jgi:hypothetical protein
MKILWTKLKTIQDYEAEIRLEFKEEKVISARRSVRILVIDDKNFAAIENLRRNQYNISHLRDLDTLDTVRDYQIILVDILGVGAKLNPTQQGAHIIKEIKRNYPSKFVVAYTGGANQDLLAESVGSADQFTKKDTSIEKWCELLDMAIQKIANPASLWRQARHLLLDRGVSPFDIACLEDTLVESLLDDPQSVGEALSRKAYQLELKDDVRAIVNSLVASALIAMLTG